MDFEMVEDLRGRLEAGSLAFYMFCKSARCFLCFPRSVKLFWL